MLMQLTTLKALSYLLRSLQPYAKIVTLACSISIAGRHRSVAAFHGSSKLTLLPLL